MPNRGTCLKKLLTKRKSTMFEKNSIFATEICNKQKNSMKKKELYFTIYCIGIVAEELGRDARDIFRLMQKGGIIKGYIVPCFDVLHTFSRDYIISDLTQLMQKKGLIAA